MQIYFIAGATTIFLIAIIGLFFITRRIKRQKISRELSLRLLSIRIPQKTNGDSRANESTWNEEINKSAQLFGILAGLNTPFVFEAAVHHAGEAIHFYIAVPRESVQSVARQIEGLWKEAQIEPTEEYTIFNPKGASVAAYIKQKVSYVLPIRTYEEARVDTFAPILSGFSNMQEVGEGAAIQVVAMPSGSFAKKNIMSNIMQLKQGKKASELFYRGIGLKDFGKALSSGSAEKDKAAPKIIDEEAVKALESKISKPLFSVNVRLVVSAPSEAQASQILNGLGHGFSQFDAPLRQELQVIKPRNQKKLITNYAFREFDPGTSMIINAEEFASFFHLPSYTADISRVAWLKSKEAAPPVNLETTGTIIGESAFRGARKPIYITDDDRRRHVYVIGQTGTGKSTIITNMAVDDIKKGKGVAIIDPHGDLIDSILSAIPQDRVEDVIVFDPANRDYPLGMNMLEYDFDKPEEKTFIVNELFNIFDKLYDMKNAGGPMFEQYFKMATLLLMEDMKNEPATLMEIQRIFTDDAYRTKKLSRVKNPVVIDFWEREATQATGDHSLANMTTYITSKINQFTANDFLRPIIGQPKSAFNFRQVMDEGKILLVNLSKGKIGDINANLLGMVITGKILMAALSRVDIRDQEKRRDFNLFIDEFQNFATDSIATILSEARKYRLNITMAHQFIAQLTDKIRDAVFGNVGNIISFRVGAPDAEFLVRQFETVFNESDLVNIDNYNAYVKILVRGATVKPFNIKTLPPEKGTEEYSDKIRELSALKYGRDREEVEAEILSRMRG